MGVVLEQASGWSRRTGPYLLLGEACSGWEKVDLKCTPRKPGVFWGLISVFLNIFFPTSWYQLFTSPHREQPWGRIISSTGSISSALPVWPWTALYLGHVVQHYNLTKGLQMVCKRFREKILSLKCEMCFKFWMAQRSCDNCSASQLEERTS